MSDTQHIQTLPFATDNGIGTKARLGMIILQSDQTLENEAAQLLYHSGISDKIGLYHSRIPNDTEVSEATLMKMASDLPKTARLLPPDFDFDAIGYGCTSGSTIIGEGEVERLIRSIHPNAKTTNPITACKAALQALGIKTIALVTPYAVPVTQAMQDNLQEAGFHVKAVATFNQFFSLFLIINNLPLLTTAIGFEYFVELLKSIFSSSTINDLFFLS